MTGMTKVLNCKSYIQSKDISGGAISSWLGYDHENFAKLYD